jgi:adenylate cyclase 10
MFLNIEKDLSRLDDEDTFIQVQKIVNTVQRCIYRTKGALNKFLMDDKGSGMLVAWGIPPFSSRYDPLDCVCSCLSIQQELTKLGLKCGMGVTTGVCFSGVCGTVGNRREYSLIGEVVNLSSRFMSKGLKYREEKGLNSIIVIDEKTQNLIQNKIKCKYLFSYDQLKGFEGKTFHFFEPIYELDNIYPTENNPFPFIRCHCYNPDNFNYLNSKIYKDEKYELQKSLMMSGRKIELKAFVSKLKDTIAKVNKKFIMIKGEYGAGKSHFIRKGLYTFFNEPNYIGLYNQYTNNAGFTKPNIILCSNQHPFVYKIPFNAVAFIFRQIYIWLNDNVFSKEKYNFNKYKIIKNIGAISIKEYVFDDITCDTFGSLICKHNCLEYIEIIEEMLSCSKEDINLSKHFNEDDFENKLKPIFPSVKLQKQIDESKKYNVEFNFKKRDPFFEKAKIKDVSSLISFLMDLLILYRKKIDDCYASESKIPLFLVIEDTQFIDEYSIHFLTSLLNNDNEILKPLIVILSYQNEFSFIKKKEDPMSKRDDFMSDMSLDDFIANDDEKIVNNMQLKNISNVKEIEETIKIYLLNHGEDRTFDSIFSIDHKLIHLLLDKSFKGNPLFMHDLIGELLDKKYIQNCVEEILTTSELDDMELEKDYNDFEIPIRIEKICGEMIDLINEHHIILLKYASVIGNLFDINTLYNILPFKDVYINDLYNTLKSFERRGLIEFLYDLDSEHKIVVCKFACPFLKETLYQRMLIEQKSEIHLQVARHFQRNKLYYFTSKKIEKNYLRKQLELGQQSIIKGMEENIEEDNNGQTKNFLQILLVHEITEKLKEIKESGYEDIELFLKETRGIDLDIAFPIKFGHLEKKGDRKLTWEKRFFVVTPKKVQYYYTSKDYSLGSAPLGIFYLKDISNIQRLPDFTYRKKQYAFQVSVTKWKKKGKEKLKRDYVFSVEKMDKLYSWIISLNYLRFYAYYDSFTLYFGRKKLELKLELPLYRVNDKKKKKLIFNIEEQAPIIHKMSTIHNNMTVKFTLSNNNQIDIDVIVFQTFLILKKLIRFGFTNILGAIQEGIINKDKYSCYINNNQINLLDFNEIKLPEHLIDNNNNFNLNENSFLISENDDNNRSILSYRPSQLSKQSFLIYYEDEEVRKDFKHKDSGDFYYKVCKDPRKDWDNESEKKTEKVMKVFNKNSSQNLDKIYEEENDIGKMSVNNYSNFMDSIDIDVKNLKNKNALVFNDSEDEEHNDIMGKKESVASSFLSKGI